MMQPQEPMFVTFGLLPKGFRLSPALVLVPTQQQLLPEDFSYLESLRFCGVDDQTGIKHPVGSCSTGCQQQQQPLCPQQGDPSAALQLGGSLEQGFDGKLHCSPRNLPLPSSRGLHFMSGLCCFHLVQMSGPGFGIFDPPLQYFHVLCQVELSLKLALFYT